MFHLFALEHFPHKVGKRKLKCPDCRKNKTCDIYMADIIPMLGPIRFFIISRKSFAKCAACHSHFELNKDIHEHLISEYGKRFSFDMKDYCKFYDLEPEEERKKLIVELFESIFMSFFVAATLWAALASFANPEIRTDVPIIAYVVLIVQQARLFIEKIRTRPKKKKKKKRKK